MQREHPDRDARARVEVELAAAACWAGYSSFRDDGALLLEDALTHSVHTGGHQRRPRVPRRRRARYGRPRLLPPSSTRSSPASPSAATSSRYSDATTASRKTTTSVVLSSQLKAHIAVTPWRLQRCLLILLRPLLVPSILIPSFDLEVLQKVAKLLCEPIITKKALLEDPESMLNELRGKHRKNLECRISEWRKVANVVDDWEMVGNASQNAVGNLTVGEEEQAITTTGLSNGSEDEVGELRTIRIEAA